MIMTSGLRKLGLSAHITFSVGWLGAVAGFLALAVAGLTSEGGERVRAAYLALECITRFVIVPFSLASLLTGVIQSLGTKWGLFRHYWVLVKLLLTALATILLFLHTQAIGDAARIAAGTAPLNEFGSLRIQLVVDAVAALLVLVVTTALGVYKPQGLTPYGQRKASVRP
jgi:hypothetical protein